MSLNISTVIESNVYIMLSLSEKRRVLGLCTKSCTYWSSKYIDCEWQNMNFKKNWKLLLPLLSTYLFWNRLKNLNETFLHLYKGKFIPVVIKTRLLCDIQISKHGKAKRYSSRIDRCFIGYKLWGNFKFPPKKFLNGNKIVKIHPLWSKFTRKRG